MMATSKGSKSVAIKTVFTPIDRVWRKNAKMHRTFFGCIFHSKLRADKRHR